MILFPFNCPNLTRLRVRKIVRAPFTPPECFSVFFCFHFLLSFYALLFCIHFGRRNRESLLLMFCFLFGVNPLKSSFFFSFCFVIYFAKAPFFDDHYSREKRFPFCFFSFAFQKPFCSKDFLLLLLLLIVLNQLKIRLVNV